MKRRIAVAAVLIALVVLWRPVLKPVGQATLLILDIYSETLIGQNVARRLTPEPRVEEASATIAGAAMRVTWWRPGWGDRHPALMVVPGASPQGNDNAALRDFAASLARSGLLVMVPEFPFLKEGRFDAAGLAQLDGAFALLRDRPETRGRSAGAFGVSVGGGMMLAAAGREPSLGRADYLVVLGAYYDIDTYLASVASASQSRRGALVPWPPSAEALERLPPAAIAAVPEADRPLVRSALAAPSYEEALRRVRALPETSRRVYDLLSPQTVWAMIGPPIFWIHDPNDSFEPLAEAEAAAAAPRSGRMVLVVPRLISHAAAAAGDEAKASGPLFVLGELWGLVAFAMEVLRLAG